VARETTIGRLRDSNELNILRTVIRYMRWQITSWSSWDYRYSKQKIDFWGELSRCTQIF